MNTIKRCEDKTEAGTYLGALRCQHCDGKSLQKLGPGLNFKDYECDQCGDVMEARDVKDILSHAEEAVKRRQRDEDQVEHLERVIKKLNTFLHPTNYVMINAKMKLGCLLGNIKGRKCNN